MKLETKVVSFGLAAALVCLQVVAMGQQKAYSHVRVVRLSFVDGTVLVKRPGSTEWAKASVNTPIEEGFSVSTGEQSFAEVEFENGSTARLGQLSQLDFSQLAVDPSGSKINGLTFDRGYATFKVFPERHEHDVYTVKAGEATVTPGSKAEFRTDLRDGKLRVEVFEGDVRVADGAQEAKLTKGKVLDTSVGAQVALNVASGIQKDDWDGWVHARDTQAELAYNDSPIGTNGSLAGWSDLDQYGAWGFFPGYGYAWSPYVATGWSPFSMGQWSFYPGMGYTWISSEPWGWLPFHYGGWAFSSMYGYLWQPGAMNAFEPGMVAWYSGAGYVGWVPLSVNGRPACNPSAAGCLTAIKPGTLQNGGVVNGGARVPVNPLALSRVPRPQVAPGALALLHGQPYQAGAVRSGVPQALALRSRVAAPRVVLMGQSMAQGSRMEALDNAHRSAFARAFGSSPSSRAPMTVRMGNTIGGRYPVSRLRANEALAARGGMNAGYSRQAPVLLRGNAAMRASGPQLRMGGSGRIQQVRSPSPSYNGGLQRSGGYSPAARASAPAMSAPASSPHSAAPAASSGSRR
ncbi:MAG: DUF6600 domain-containing protein [Terriglobia bacterium]